MTLILDEHICNRDPPVVIVYTEHLLLYVSSCNGRVNVFLEKVQQHNNQIFHSCKLIQKNTLLQKTMMVCKSDSIYVGNHLIRFQQRQRTDRVMEYLQA